MAYVELCLHLEFDPKRAAPEVRAWVDLDPDGQHARETELALERRQSCDWYGAFAVAESGPRCMLYRVALVAHAGAQWSLSMHQRNRSRALLSDHDTLPMAKGWLVGTCELAREDAQVWPPYSASQLPRRAVQTGSEAREAATVLRLDRTRRP